MRDHETIDAELRLIALRRQAILEQGGQPSSQQVDALLDERLGHLVMPETAPVTAGKTAPVAPSARKRARRRFGPLAVLPLSLLAVATAAVVVMIMFGAHKSPPEQPAAAPPSSSARPIPAAPPPRAAPALDLVDRAFIDVLKHDGIPVPSPEYATSQGHAVCEFLTHQTNFAEAVRFVQRTSIWDADQSAKVTAGAVVSYCPQYVPTGPDQTQPGAQNALTDLQGVEGNLQRIQDDLRRIEDGLPAIPGHQ